MIDWHADGACHVAPDAWTDPVVTTKVGRENAAAAAEVCVRDCAVLHRCREWAAGHYWTGVVIAGWKAPTIAARPPWARREKENESVRYEDEGAAEAAA